MMRTMLTRAALTLAGAACLTALVMARPARPARPAAPAARAGTSATAVADAAMRGEAALARQLVAQGADVNAPQNDGMTALHWAALNGDLALTQALLAHGANVNARTRVGSYTPLDLAAKDGHGAIVQALLKGGAKATTADIFGTTPLMLAAASGNTDAVTALIEAGADVNARELVKGETALMLAAANDRPAAMRILLAHGADWRPATKVVDWTKGMDAGLRARSTVYAEARTQQASSSSAAPAADEGAEIYGYGGKKGAVSGDEGNPRYPRLVGKQGGLTALMFAARQGYAEAADALLKAGADVNEVDPGDKTSPLMIAIVNGHYDLAETLLKAGADPNAAQINGATPLYAVLNCQWAPKADYPQPTAYKNQKTNYLTLMTDLLAHGANPNARLKEKVWYTSYNRDYSGLDESGATPFWRAAWADDVDAMKLLVAHGADPNIWTINPGSAVSIYQQPGYGLNAVRKDYSGQPPVPKGGPDIPPLLAASGEEFGSSLTAGKLRWSPAGMLPAVKYLVEDLHADVNARDAKGDTALHNAAARGDNAMILYLVSKGADIKAVNRRGQTVADMANGPFQRIDPFPETIALVERLGGKLAHKCVSCGG